MSSKQTIVRGAFLSSGGMGLSMVAMFATMKLFTNALDEGAIGAYTLILIAADLLFRLAVLGLPFALPKLLPEAGEDRTRLIATINVFLAAVSLAIVIVCYSLWALCRSWLTSGNAEWTIFFAHLWLVPPLFVLNVFREFAQAALAGLKRYAQRSASVVLVAVAQLVLVFLLVWRLGGGLPVLVLSAVIANFVAVAYLIVCLPEVWRPYWDWRLLRRSIAFSGPLYANHLLGFLYQSVDTVLVGLLFGLDLSGIYGMAKRIPLLMSRLMGALLVPFLPSVSSLLAQGERERGARLLNQAQGLMAFASYGATLAIVFLQGPIILLVFKEEYLASLPALWLLLAAISLAMQTGLAGQTLVALSRPGTVAAINVVMVVLSLGGNAILLPWLGIAGAGWAALIAMAVSNLLQMAAVTRCGLRVEWGRHLITQSAMAISLGLVYYGSGHAAIQVPGLLLFVATCFGARVVSVAQLRGIAASLRPQG